MQARPSPGSSYPAGGSGEPVGRGGGAEACRAADDVDVLVAGAGPAGTAAAITLARLGRRVMVVDKAVFPRDKCCGDGLTTAALRRLEHLGLDPQRVRSWQPVDEVTVVAADGRRADLPFAKDGTQYAASARRIDLDSALVDLARRAGADIVEGCAVSGVSLTDLRNRVRVTLEDGRLVHARYVVGADGMWSPVRRSLGLSDAGYLGEWQAGRQYLEATGPLSRRLWVWFEPDMLPGYAWSFPLPGGMVNFGYGVLRPANGDPASPRDRDRDRDPVPASSGGGDRHEEGDGSPAPRLRGQQIDWSDRPHIAKVLGPDATPAGPWRAWPIPARIGAAALDGLGGRVLFLGDAAGGCDPMTGEGIAQALETGEMAARAIVQAGPHSAASAATRYRRQIRWGLALDDRLSRQLSRILARPGGSGRALSMVEASDWCRRNFGRWMFEDYPRAVLATPHRWHRHMFSGPGAYRDR